MTEHKEKCLVQIPTYNDDGTAKDIDYWFLCLKDEPCPIHNISHYCGIKILRG